MDTVTKFCQAIVFFGFGMLLVFHFHCFKVDTGTQKPKNGYWIEADESTRDSTQIYATTLEREKRKFDGV